MPPEATAEFRNNSLSLCINEYPPGFDIQAYCFPFRPPFVHVPVLNIPARSLTAADVATEFPILVSATAAPDKGSPTRSGTQSQASPTSTKNNAPGLGKQSTASTLESKTSSSDTRLPAVANALLIQASNSTRAADPIKPVTTYAEYGPKPVPAPKATPSQPESTQVSQNSVLSPIQLLSGIIPQFSDVPSSAAATAQGFGANTFAQKGTEVNTANARYDASGIVVVPQIITVDSQVFTVSPGISSGCNINDKSLAPGSAITPAGILLSLPVSGSVLVAGSHTIQFSQAVKAAMANNPTITPLPAISSGVVIGGQYLAPGGMITVSGVSLSLPVPDSALAAGGNTIGLEAAIQTIPVGSQIFNFPLEPHPSFAINGQTLAPGSVVTVNGIIISLPTSGSAIIVGSSTVPLGYTTTATAGGETFTISLAPTSGLVINGQTILPGQAGSVEGILVSLPIHGPNVIIGSSTIVLSPLDAITAAGQTFTPLPGSSSGNVLGSPKVIIIGGHTFTLSSGGFSEIVINSQTLTPGEATTIDGIPVSLPFSESSLIIGTSTIALSPDSAEIISAGSQALTVEKGPSSALIVDGQTISPGEEEVIDGFTISLPTSGTDLVVGTSAIGLAPLIMSGFGIDPTSTSVLNATTNGTALAFAGGVSRLSSVGSLRWEWIVVVILVSWIVGS